MMRVSRVQGFRDQGWGLGFGVLGFGFGDS